ncbi:MAG TPA: hypothetical protein VFC46_04260, partial [Humisphaera sp.]|nr:hypothetical protein [Humisphaera sp.]
MISDTNKFVKWRPDRPMCGCLLLCKEAEEYGEQLNLRGIINGVYAEAFPTILGPFVVHFEGTNLHGGDEIILAFYCLEDDQRLRGFKATVAAGCTPQAMCTMDLRVPELKVPRAGRYILTASHLGFVFAEAIFEVQTPHERVATAGNKIIADRRTRGPMCSCLLLSEAGQIDTKPQVTLLSVFHTICSGVLPVNLGPYALHVRLSNLSFDGKERIAIALRSAENNKPMFTCNLTLPVELDPVTTYA